MRSKPEAYADIAEDSPDAADRIVNEIFDRLRQLADVPGLGFRRPNYTSLPLRFIVIRDYLIAYAPDTSPLWVIAVLHGRRYPRLISAILRGRESLRRTSKSRIC